MPSLTIVLSVSISKDSLLFSVQSILVEFLDTIDVTVCTDGNDLSSHDVMSHD